MAMQCVALRCANEAFTLWCASLDWPPSCLLPAFSLGQCFVSKLLATPQLHEWMVLQAFLIGADSSGSSAIGKAICQRAEDVNADVVIASRHSKEVLAEGIMGSTSVYLARRCTKPLVLLP